MSQPVETLPPEQPTQHAMLVVWGQFAQELGLLDQLASVPIPQKTVQQVLSEFGARGDRKHRLGVSS